MQEMLNNSINISLMENIGDKKGYIMTNLSATQIRFLEALRDIQIRSVLIAQNECKESFSLETILFNVTYDTICGIMEVIDGYYSEELRLDLIEKESKESVKGNLELHDICADYIRCE